MANLPSSDPNLRTDLTDGVDDVMSTDINSIADEMNIAGAMLRDIAILPDLSSTDLMSTDLVLSDTDVPLRYLDLNGAARNVYLPAESSDNHPFIMANVSTDAQTATVLTSSSDSVDTIAQDEAKLFFSNGQAWKALSGGGGTPATVFDLRLTLASGTPVTTSDQTAKTTIYLAFYKGNRALLYDGSAWVIAELSSELSVSVPATTTTPFDIFLDYNDGTPQLLTVNWTNDTTRATALTRQDGRYVKTGDAQQLYIGTGRTTGSSGQCEDSLTKRFLWNYYNRVVRPLKRTEGTTSWGYSSATIRQANGSSSNQVAVVIGIAEDAIWLSLLTSGIPNATNNYGYAGIGEDKTTGFDGHMMGGGGGATSAWFVFSAYLNKIPTIGYHYYSWNERSDANGPFTFYGVGAVGFLGSGLLGNVIG